MVLIIWKDTHFLHTRMQIKTTIMFHFSHVKLAKIQKLHHTSCWWGRIMLYTGNAIYTAEGYGKWHSLTEGNLAISNQLYIIKPRHRNHSVNLSWTYISNDMKQYENTDAQGYHKILPVILKNRLDELQYIQKMEYCAA